MSTTILNAVRDWTTARDNIVRANNVTQRLMQRGLVTPRSDDFVRKFTTEMDTRTAALLTLVIADFGRDFAGKVAEDEPRGQQGDAAYLRSVYVDAEWSEYDREGLHELLMNFAKMLS